MLCGCCSSLDCVFFFFQAEDGIRGWSVTGVQTCALPISDPNADVGSDAYRRALATDPTSAFGSVIAFNVAADRAAARSEERRVGKECSRRSEQSHARENNHQGAHTDTSGAAHWRRRDRVV